MRIKRFMLQGVGVLVILASCNSLPYKDDIGFFVSAQADSPEFPVYINGKLCTDTEGFVGLCAKRVKSTEAITLKFDAMVYSYRLTVNCTQGVTPIAPATVPAGQAFELQIKPDDFSQFRNFTCIGEVSPQDRAPPISAQFQVRFVVVDARYVQRERAYLDKIDGKSVLILGEFARTAWVYDESKWKPYQKTTIVELHGAPEKVKAYSESFAMRFNYLNMGADDVGISNTIND